MEELTTRGPVKDPAGLTHAWALQSGRTTERFTGPARRTETLPGIRLCIPTQGAPAVLDLADAHEAGELYTQLEAHLENIAAPAAEEAKGADTVPGWGRYPALAAALGRDEAKTAEDALASPVEASGLAIMDRDVRNWTDAQCRGAWNHAMEGRNPNDLTDRPTGREYTSLAAIRLRERLNRINGADAERDALPRLTYANGEEFTGERITIPTAEYQRLLANSSSAAPTAAGFVTMVPLELKEAAEAVVAAWTNEGQVQEFHHDTQVRLRRNWPALVAAVERLANASR